MDPSGDVLFEGRGPTGSGTHAHQSRFGIVHMDDSRYKSHDLDGSSCFFAEIRRSVHFQTNTNEAAKRPLRCAFFTDWMNGNPYAMISETWTSRFNTQVEMLGKNISHSWCLLRQG